MASNLRLRLLTTTVAMGAAALAANPAWAQPDDQVAEPATTSQPTEEVVEDGGVITVTGSRIQRRDLTSTSPVAVIQDEEFTLSGSTNVEQVINSLPQVVPGATSFSNNPGGGVSTLNLRGLGAQRNLVLVNGRRYIFFDTTQTVDLNTIPSFLVGSVDVVTGGASAVYGSDALAGVINFRLRNDIDGIIAGANYNITGEGDGRRYGAHMAIGTQFADNRGNITIFAEYSNRGSISQGARDFSRFALSDGVNGLVPGGSAGVPQGRFVAAGTLAIGPGASCGGTGNPPRNAGCFPIAEGTNFPGNGAFFGTPGSSVPYTGGAQAYNYAPANFLMVPQERWTLGGYGEYEIAEGITAFAEVNFINNRVENELAASPLTQNVDFNLAAISGFLSTADLNQLRLIASRQQEAQRAAAAAGVANPFPGFTAGTGQFAALNPGCTDPDGAGPLLPDPATCQNVRLSVNTRFTQIANRNASDDRNAFRVLGGLKGNITDTVTYEAYYMFSRTRNSQIQEGNVSRSSFTRLAANGTCNPFGLDQYSPACIAGVGILAQNTDISQLQVAQASISAPLFTFGTASEPVAFAAGVEWREMEGQFIPDTALQSGDVVGFNAGQSTEGDYNVKEVFGEVRIPIVEENFIHRLEINAAGRYSDYSLDAIGGVETYSVGARLAPIRQIEFRGQYQRAVRAPNVFELFGGQSIGFPPATDPCSARTAVADRTDALRQLCIATGVPAANVFQAFIQPNDQIQSAGGGNPNLQEEVSDTFTAGVVLRPFPRLNITIDYFDIKVDQAIALAGGGAAGILNLCYIQIADASSPVCALISRDAQGSISGPPNIITAGRVNLSSFETSGVDLALDYDQPLAFSLTGAGDSRLNFSFLGTWTEKNNFTAVVGTATQECAGRFGLICGNPTPEYKWTTRLSWVDGPVTTSVRWRHTGAVRDDDDTTDYFIEEIEAYDLIDLAVGFNVNDNLTLNIGVNNLFDTTPPLLGSNQEQSNTYPGVYDVLGRDFFVSAQFRF